MNQHLMGKQSTTNTSTITSSKRLATSSQEETHELIENYSSHQVLQEAVDENVAVLEKQSKVDKKEIKDLKKKLSVQNAI
jgi:hypothetical protein